MSMLCDGLKQWEQFIGLHNKHVEDDGDDRMCHEKEDVKLSR
jgi:hypothetical protein